MTHQQNKPVPSDPIVSHPVTFKRRATPDPDGINHHVRSGHRMATGEILDRICLFLPVPEARQSCPDEYMTWLHQHVK